MKFEIDARLASSPSEQIVEQVRFAIASGRLNVGARLPSVRAAAASSRVNPNTISKAYRELESVGSVELRRGDGVYVSAKARRQCAADAKKKIEERANRLVSDALAAGLAAAELKRMVNAACAKRSGAKRKGA